MFRFAIRDVLWFTLVFGLVLSLGIGWWRERSFARKLAGELKLMQTINRNIPIDEPIRLTPGICVTILSRPTDAELTFSFVPPPDEDNQE